MLKKLESAFKNQPLLSDSILSILSVMAQFQTKYSKEFGKFVYCKGNLFFGNDLYL